MIIINRLYIYLCKYVCIYACILFSIGVHLCCAINFRGHAKIKSHACTITSTYTAPSTRWFISTTVPSAKEYIYTSNSTARAAGVSATSLTAGWDDARCTGSVDVVVYWLVSVHGEFHYPGNNWRAANLCEFIHGSSSNDSKQK